MNCFYFTEKSVCENIIIFDTQQYIKTPVLKYGCNYIIGLMIMYTQSGYH